MNEDPATGRVVGRLTVYLENAPVALFPLKSERLHVVGRSDDAHCRIDHHLISRRHLEIDTRENPWRITDPGSKNGSRIAGKPLDQAVIEKSCWLSIAGIPAHLEVLDKPSARQWQQELQHRHTTARILSRQLEQPSPVDDLIEKALSAFVELAECDAGSLILANRDGRLKQVAGIGEHESRGSQSVIEQVASDHNAVISSDVRAMQSLAERQSVVAGGIRALVCLPLTLAGELRGIVYADSTRAGKIFTELDAELLEAMAQQIAFVLALSRMRTEAEALRIRLPDSPRELASSTALKPLLDRVLPPQVR